MATVSGKTAGHGLTMYDKEVRVPLIVTFPDGRFAGVRCDDVVRLLDLYPTVTHCARAETPGIMQGVDLVQALTHGDSEPRIAFGVSPNLGRPEGHGGESCVYVRREGIEYIDAPPIATEFLVREHLARGAGDEDYDVCVVRCGYCRGFRNSICRNSTISTPIRESGATSHLGTRSGSRASVTAGEEGAGH